ncbi:hypothetical protein EDC04DRAFT_1242522 [Pisolithus marmoratus]|nr:hypothetical protein EDC04DRAFT_1242522 [Pisolithus marmoratus]
MPSSLPPHILKRGQNVDSIIRAVAHSPLHMWAIPSLSSPSPPKPSCVPDLLSMSAPLHSQKMNRLQDSGCQRVGYGAAPSFGPFDDEKPDWTMDGFSSALPEARERSTPTSTGMADDVLFRNNHPLNYAPPNDHWGACYRASNHSAHPNLSFSLPLDTDLSLHHIMRHSLGYSQGDENIATSKELSIIHHASAAPAKGLISTFPCCGHAPFQFHGQSEDHDGMSWRDRIPGKAVESEVSWSAPSNLVLPAPPKLYPSDYSGGENAQTSTDMPTFRSFCIGTAMNTTAEHILHDAATGMTSGFEDDLDPVSNQSIGSTLPSSSPSDAVQLPHQLYTLEHLPHTGSEELATLPGPRAADYPHEDMMIYRDRTACGWIEPNGAPCNKPIGYHCQGHFATAHGVKDISSGVKVRCRWCPLSAQKEVGRKGFIRHLREVHMKYLRPKTRGLRTLEKKRKKRLHQSSTSAAIV